MQTPIVTEISTLSAHRREVELVRMSLMAVPERTATPSGRDLRDPLRAMRPVAVPARRELVSA